MASMYTVYMSEADASAGTNGFELPTPSYGSGQQISSTLVKSGRSANGRVKTKRVMDRNLVKLTLNWAYLTANQWRDILSTIEDSTSTFGAGGFYVWIRYFDMEEAVFKTREFYPSDRTAQPFRIDPVTKAVKSWINCSLNFIDTGNPTEY
jgi:hypothetical protein